MGGRREPLPPSAFLIDQHGGVVVSHRGTKAGDQGSYLRRVDDVALEQNEPPWTRIGEQGLLIGREHGCGTAADEGAAHWVPPNCPREKSLLSTHQAILFAGRDQR